MSGAPRRRRSQLGASARRSCNPRSRKHSFHLATLHAAADFAHAAAEPPTQQRSQSHTFRIADFGGDLQPSTVSR